MSVASIELFERMRVALGSLLGATDPDELRGVKAGLQLLAVPTEESGSIISAIDVLIEASTPKHWIGQACLPEGTGANYIFASGSADGGIPDDGRRFMALDVAKDRIEVPVELPTEFAYSIDEESFYNDTHPSRDAALAAAQARFPDQATIWTARKIVIDYGQLVDVDSLHENMQVQLGEFCGEASEDWQIEPELLPKLQELIVEFLERENGPITCWSIEDVEQHEVAVTE